MPGTARRCTSSRESSRSSSRIACIGSARRAGSSSRPRSCTHVEVTGDAPARFLVLHAPGSGYGDYVRGDVAGVRPARRRRTPCRPIPGSSSSGGRRRGGRHDHRPAGTARDRARRDRRAHDLRVRLRRGRARSAAARAPRARGRVPRRRGRVHVPLPRRVARPSRRDAPRPASERRPRLRQRQRRLRALLQLPHAVVRLRATTCAGRTPTSTSSTLRRTAESTRPQSRSP